MTAFDHVRSMSQQGAEAQRDGRWVACISVGNGGDWPALHVTNAHRFMCHEEPMYALYEAELTRLSAWVYAQRHPERVLLVHCSHGVSRSPAIANAIAGHFNCDVHHLARFAYPRADVYDAVLHALQQYATTHPTPVQELV